MTAMTERAEPVSPAEATGEMTAGPALPAANAELAAAIDEQLVRQLAGRAEAAGRGSPATLRPRPSRFAPGRSLTASFRGRIRHLAGGDWGLASSWS